MDKYDVKISPKAFQDLDEIYSYIVKELQASETALKLVKEIEDAILSLDIFPYRGSDRKIGKFANKGYKQIFVKNYTILYRINEPQKQVVVITIRYSSSNF